MKSETRLIALLLFNIALPVATLLLTGVVGSLEAISEYKENVIIISFGVIGALAAIINTKCSPKWLAKPYTFYLFTVSWAITWVSYSKIESDLSDKRLEQIRAAHSPGQGFGVLLVVGALLLFMIAVVYLLTQWIYQSVSHCKKKR
jgi:membrane protease YdiL (CAAX protease family)